MAARTALVGDEFDALAEMLDQKAPEPNSSWRNEHIQVGFIQTCRVDLIWLLCKVQQV